jgi:hypothetical protein
MSRPRLDRRSTRHAIDEEVNGIESTSERVFFTCGGSKHVKETTGSTDKPVANFSRFDFASCGKKPVAIVHTHGIASGVPSNVDIETNKGLFEFPGVKVACSTGIDGIFCADKKGHVRRSSLSKPQEKRVLDETGTVKVSGDSVFCDDIGGGAGKYFCSVQQGLNPEKPIGLFDDVSMVGGISWGADGKADLTMSTQPGKTINCFAGTRGKEKRLSCIVSGFGD